MIEYNISYQNPNSHIIDIEVIINEITGDNSLLINLPAWRPGRYELANYAKNVYRVDAFAMDDERLVCKKISKDQWEIDTKSKANIKVKYSYYAFQMDAGNSWLDDEQLYVNPINCLIYIKERIQERCFLKIHVPASYKIVTGLKEVSPGKFLAKDYYELSDCPLFASATLKNLRYSINEIDFNIWIQGENYLDEKKVLKDFKQFSEYQIRMMGEFPEKEYHFMFQFLPYAFRHGVEHRNSTVITMGPSNLIQGTLYPELLGISSHELFHCWNVLKIRPKELMPYDFSTENYYETGYTTEGFTTYYGDLLLGRSKVFSIEQFLRELNDLLKRHFENEGNLNLSLAESSFDLWLDGYVPGTPGRKVSIYIKGALVAFLMDIHIRKTSANKYSLDHLIRELWRKFGKKGIGFEEKDIIEIAENFKVDLRPLIKKAVYGTGYLKKELEDAFSYLGMKLDFMKPSYSIESVYGIKCLNANNKWLVEKVSNDSPAYKLISKNDEIIAVNNSKFEVGEELPDSIAITFIRGNKIFSEQLERSNKTFFAIPSLKFKKERSMDEQRNFELWLDL
jgi:predicted metalloprotease with PDZ domain